LRSSDDLGAGRQGARRGSGDFTFLRTSSIPSWTKQAYRLLTAITNHTNNFSSSNRAFGRSSQLESPSSKCCEESDVCGNLKSLEPVVPPSTSPVPLSRNTAPRLRTCFSIPSLLPVAIAAPLRSAHSRRAPPTRLERFHVPTFHLLDEVDLLLTATSNTQQMQ